MRFEDAPKAICVFDVESTGTSIENDRIITCYAMIQSIKGEILEEKHWVIDPGVDVPKGASDVHGMSTEWVREHGRKDVAEAIFEINWFLEGAISNGTPIVGYNNSYDLGILDREMSRHNERGLNFGRGYFGPEVDGLFFDPIIYDRAMDKYRKGGRKLMDVARHYGIPIDESRLHQAEYDVIVTARLAWLLLKKSPHTVSELQGLQEAWKRDWAGGLTKYFANSGKTEPDGSKIIVDGSFPYEVKGRV